MATLTVSYLKVKILYGPVEYFLFIGHRCLRTVTDISERECSKTFVQQGRSRFDARSVLPVRERERRKAPSLRARRSGKRGRMSLAAFFNIPRKDLTTRCGRKGSRGAIGWVIHHGNQTRGSSASTKIATDPQFPIVLKVF